MIVIVGGGVIGLSCARALARAGRQVSVIERHARVGFETSTRNSGVIHAGLYYPAASLKARLCVEGREPLYRYCEEQGVPHVRCGKLLVAQRDEEDELARVASCAAASGAHVVPVDRAFIAAREPNVRADLGLWSPDTGWLDAAALVHALERDIVARGVTVRKGSGVDGIESRPGGLTVVTRDERLEAELVVNAAGLYADEISALAGGETFRIHPCRGEYAELSMAARHLINGLVYPVPHPLGHSLGLHFTRTIDGTVLIGPTVHFQDRKDDYGQDRLPLSAFVAPVREILPSIGEADLRLSGCGIRPRLRPASEGFADFLIARDARNAHLIHAAGIESPGLTACLAIGDLVAAIV